MSRIKPVNIGDFVRLLEGPWEEYQLPVRPRDVGQVVDKLMDDPKDRSKFSVCVRFDSGGLDVRYWFEGCYVEKVHV